MPTTHYLVLTYFRPVNVFAPLCGVVREGHLLTLDERGTTCPGCKDKLNVLNRGIDTALEQHGLLTAL